MTEPLLHLVDYVLFALHLAVIIINLFGWILKRTRKLQAITLLFTAGSWFIIGIWYGWGYCFLTDWEWEIKIQLGERFLPASYVHYLVNNTLGLGISTTLLDQLTLILFTLGIAACFYVNFKGLKSRFKRLIDYL